MTLLYIDRDTANKFILLSATNDRKYYTASRSTGKLALLVCQNGLDLDELHGRVVDVSIGWDYGTRGFCQDDNIDHKQTKISLRRPVGSDRGETTLRRILRKAPNGDI